MSSAGQFVLASGGIDFTTPGTGTFYNPGQSDATGFNFLSNQIIAYTANTPVLHINSNGNIGINQS